jgi:hypothetical protein
MSGTRIQPGWLAVNPQTVPSSHKAKSPLEAVLIWIILLTPRQQRAVISQTPYELRWPLRPPFNCLPELLRGHSQLLCPIPEFVILVDIDPVVVPVIAFRCVVGHSEFCSPIGTVTDLDTYVK